MAALLDFLNRLFKDGEVVFQGPPVIDAGERSPVVKLLRRVFADYQLEVAGPPLDFREEAALAAAEFARQACWFLVHRGEPAAEVERRLSLPPPRQPADHLSADLVLRYLPAVHQRARAAAPGDPLAGRLAEVLRQWPLAGVLSDVADGPLTPLDFGGHPGLQMLYAERLAENCKPAWVPPRPMLEYVELVFHELGLELPPAAAPGADRDAERND